MVEGTANQPIGIHTVSDLLSHSETLRRLRAEARRHADFIHLPLRNKVWQGGAGEFMGRGVGSSLDFQDHRAYAPGDDPRHINWQAYARTGQYSMKLFREEVRPVVDVVLDASASMFFDDTKAQRTVELFYFCVDSALRAGASLRVFLLNGGEHRLLASEECYSDAWPERIPEVRLTAPPAEPPALAAIPLRPQALRIFLSDLLYPGAPETIVHPLASRQGRGVIFAPHCNAEAQADWDGNYDFFEPESGTRHLRRVEPALLQRYRAAYRRHFQVWKEGCQRHGVALARVAAEPDLQRALQGEALAVGAVEMR